MTPVPREICLPDVTNDGPRIAVSRLIHCPGEVRTVSATVVTLPRDTFLLSMVQCIEVAPMRPQHEAQSFEVEVVRLAILRYRDLAQGLDWTVA